MLSPRIVAVAGKLSCATAEARGAKSATVAPFDSVGPEYRQMSMDARRPSRTKSIEELPVALGLLLGAVAFSHWVLDLIVHRADMPILPGNAGGLPLLGLAALGLASIVAGASVLGAGIRRGR